MMNKLLIGLLAAACLLPGPSSAGSVYRWTDADGGVHFGQVPPPGAQASVWRPPSGGPDAETAARRLEALKRKAGLAPAAEAPAEPKPAEEEVVDPEALARREAEDAAIRRKNCEVARQNLAVLQAQGPLATRTEDGKVKRWTDSERQERLAETRRQVAENCAASAAAGPVGAEAK